MYKFKLQISPQNAFNVALKSKTCPIYGTVNKSLHEFMSRVIKSTHWARVFIKSFCHRGITTCILQN